MKREDVKVEPESVPAPFSRGDSLGYKFYRLAQLFARALDERLAQHGVAIGQFRVLLVLWEQEHVTQAEIARYLGIEQPTVANTLKRMERDGLIVTTLHHSDRRRTRISLTERGRMLKEPLTKEAQYINDVASKDLSESETEELNKALDVLTNALLHDKSPQ